MSFAGLAQAARIASRIGHLATFTYGQPGDGVTRPGYTQREREAHHWFADELSALGFAVRCDAAGNTIAELHGTDPDLPAIGTGSHLDSVPHGGRFDGIVGVVGAMEVASILHALDVRPRHPLRIVAFACEEGARFGLACIGSRIAANLTHSSDLSTLVDAQGITAAEAFTSVGLDPATVDDARWCPDQWAAFVEMHIEQGSVLHSSQCQVGVVDVVSGSTRLLITVAGETSHSGGTPMHLRHDALLTAAEIALAGETIATDSRHHGTRLTVGRITVGPNFITSIAGSAILTVDVRDTDAIRQRATAAEVVRAAQSIARDRGCTASCDLIGDAAPTFLAESVRETITTAAQRLGIRSRSITSGASHDAQMIGRVVPTGMIFVPSLAGGVSHDPKELSDPDEIAVGADVLTATLMALDWSHAPSNPAASQRHP